MVGFERDSVVVEEPPALQHGGRIIVAEVERRILPAGEDGDGEGRRIDAVDAVRSGMNLPAVAGVAAEFFPVGVEVMPFVQVQLGAGEALRVEQGAHPGRLGGDFGRVGRVAVPAEEVERRVGGAAGVEKGVDPSGVAAGIGRASDLDAGETCLELFRGQGVEFEVAFERRIPHVAGEVGLVPDLPVADVPGESVVPPFVVVAHDVDADVAPLFEILRRERVIAPDSVFDADAEPVDDIASAAAAGRQVVVGLPEIVVRLVGGVRVAVAEEERHVHETHVAVFERRVVQPRIRRAQRGEVRRQIARGFLRNRRRGEVDSVQPAYRAGFPRVIDRELHLMFHRNLPDWISVYYTRTCRKCQQLIDDYSDYLSLFLVIRDFLDYNKGLWMTG